MKSLLKKIQRAGILLELVGGELKIYSGKSPVDPSIIAEIRRRKQELTDFLSANDQRSFEQSYAREISAIPTAEDYALSPSQHRLWIASRFKASNTAYNLPGTYVFEGKLDVEALNRSFDELLSRHESLRTVFIENQQGEVRQKIQPLEALNFKIDHHDLRNLREDRLHALIQSDFSLPFDLSQGPLLRVNLYRTGGTQTIFTYTMHHIISDAWSMGILLKELLISYNRHSRGETDVQAPLPIHYKDFAAWQREQLSGENSTAHKSYWLDRFSEEPPVLAYPTANTRPPIKTYSGKTVSRQLPAPLIQELRSIQQATGTTLFMGLLALVKTLLYRYTHQEDIVIGTSIANREHTDLENQIGFYVNTLALRTRFKGTDSYQDLLNRVKQTTLGAYEHQIYPFDTLIEDLGHIQDRGRSPLFDVMVVLQNTDVSSSKITEGLIDLEVSNYHYRADTISKFDMTFFFSEQGGAIKVDLSYNSDIYREEDMERLTEHLEAILEAIVKTPATAINTLDYLSKEAKETLLSPLGPLKRDHGPAHTILDGFKSQAQKTPNAIALTSEGKTLTYEALDQQTNQLAHYLIREHRIQSNDLVGIVLDRSENMIIALLGILKSGGAYVAIETGHPQSRKEHILTETKSKVVLTQTDYLFDLGHYQGALFAMDVQLEGLTAPTTPVERPPLSSDLAYVTYTSGSTGAPKGVMIQHSALLDYCHGLLSQTNLRDCERFGLVSTIAADLGNTMIYGALLTGGNLHIFTTREVTDASAIAKADLDALKIVPSHWQALQTPDTLLAPRKSLIFGGEALTAETLHHLNSRNATCQVYNHYGPTETTIGKLLSPIDPSAPTNITLGTPMGNNAVDILDADHQLCPVNVIGELCISGAGLSKGYLNDPDQTAGKFVPHPYRPGVQMYRTGDLGSRRPDGTIVYAGRKDDQVKIRGHRVEPTETNHHLQQHPAVKSSVIRPYAQAGETTLIAYVVSETVLDPAALHGYLSKGLPDYMLPGKYMQIEALPLTPNGKVDHQRLPSPEAGQDDESAYLAARNPTEEQLIAIWQEVLGRERIGVTDDFFRLGGHSLKATRLASQIHKSFEVKLDLAELFDSPILEQQAELIDKESKTVYTSIPKAAPASSYFLSSAQQRLHFLYQFERNSLAYNMPQIVRLVGPLDKVHLLKVFNQLVMRHEGLRTYFEEQGGEVVQIILPQIDFNLEYHTCGEEEVSSIINTFIRPFDLHTAPLIRAGLIQVADASHILMIDMHHIITDGTSQGVLMRDFVSLYNHQELPELKLHYKDYSEWLKSTVYSEQKEKQREYWLNQLSGEIPVLNLPADHEYVDGRHSEGKNFSFQLTCDETSKVNEFIKQQSGVTLFTFLLTTYNLLLSRLCNQEDIIVGSPVDNRSHADTEHIIGIFLNTLAFRNYPKKEKPFVEFLKEVQQTTLDAFHNQDYQFEDLISELNLTRDVTRNPLFDAFFNLLNFDQVATDDFEELQLEHYDTKRQPIAKFHISLYAKEHDGKMEFTCVYKSCYFKEETIEYIFTEYKKLITEVLESPNNQLKEFKVFDQAKLPLRKDVVTPVKDFTPYSASEIHQSIPERFRTIVQKYSHKPAIKSGQLSLSYRQLDELSNQVANLILSVRREPHDNQYSPRIALLFSHGINMITAIFGALKSGHAYVPIDPLYPVERIQRLIMDSGAEIILTETEQLSLSEKVASTLEVINVDEIGEDISTAPTNLKIDPASLCYILYTSGSTGNPKGVMQSHKNVLHFWRTYANALHIDAEDKMTMLSNYCHDASKMSIYGALLSGATGYLYDVKERGVEPLKGIIEQEEISIFHSTPSVYRAFVRALENHRTCKSLRFIVLGGELALNSDMKNYKKYFSDDCILLNGLGPTESTLALQYFINKNTQPCGAHLPVGYPVDNTRVHILNKKGELADVFETGEIVIESDYLTIGYWKDREKTHQVLIEDLLEKGKRYYRSGDMGKILPNSMIAFKDRIDDQVKIRGFRVELGEIVSQLTSHHMIDESVVLVLGNNEAKHLVAYYVSEQKITTAILRNYLSEKLPDYMVPTDYIHLKHIPLTANGKVDRQALPAPEIDQHNTHVAPSNELEMELLDIWSEVLSLEAGKISVTSNFFELGGHSLLAMHMVSAIKRKLDIEMSVKALFLFPSIELLSRSIQVNIDNDNVDADEYETMRL